MRYVILLFVMFLLFIIIANCLIKIELQYYSYLRFLFNLHYEFNI